jgi:hypothetical protein
MVLVLLLPFFLRRRLHLGVLGLLLVVVVLVLLLLLVLGRL